MKEHYRLATLMELKPLMILVVVVVIFSWGKYISAPDVAREELRVLCLNCSAITEPISKPENEPPRSKPKRSKYFPR